MESYSNDKIINGQRKAKAWYCDSCGGYFTIEDSGTISEDAHFCRECVERCFHVIPKNTLIH